MQTWFSWVKQFFVFFVFLTVVNSLTAMFTHTISAAPKWAGIKRNNTDQSTEKALICPQREKLPGIIRKEQNKEQF